MLFEYDDDALVVFGCDYGDHSHTIQLLPVTEVTKVEEDEYVDWSAYSHSEVSLEKKRDDDYDDDEVEEADDEPLPEIVILR